MGNVILSCSKCNGWLLQELSGQVMASSEFVSELSNITENPKELDLFRFCRSCLTDHCYNTECRNCIFKNKCKGYFKILIQEDMQEDNK